MGTQTYTSGSGTWTVPAGVTSVTVEMCGGGGSGGASNTYMTSGGGGAGCIRNYTISGLTPGSSINYSIGAGGAAVSTTSDVVDGNDGGNSSFGPANGTTLTCYGGKKGYGNGNTNTHGDGGNATNGSTTANGGATQGANGGTQSAGGGTLYGGGAGNNGGTSGNSYGSGSTSNYPGGASLGNGSAGAYQSGNATAGTNGAGGGGCYSGGTVYSSAKGGEGRIVLTWTDPGWTGKISGVSAPAKVMGVAKASIHAVNGVH